MGKVAIGYGNLVDTSTLSGTLGTSFHSLADLRTRELAKYADSATSADADKVLVIDHQIAKAAQAFALFATFGFDASATITVTRGTSSLASDVYAGSALTCWPFAPINGDLDGGHFGVIVVTQAETSARFTNIAISSSSIIRIGRVFVGPIFVPDYNPVYGEYVDEWQPPNSALDRTENGADWPITRTELRANTFSYQAMSHGRASLMHEIVRTHSVTGEVVFLPSTDDRERQQQYGFLGTMRKLSALEYPFFDHRSTAIAIDERGGAP